MAKKTQPEPAQVVQQPTEIDPLAAVRNMESDGPEVLDPAAEAEALDGDVTVAGDVHEPPPPVPVEAPCVRYFCLKDTTLSWGEQFITVHRDQEVHDGNYGPNAVKRMKDMGVPFREEQVE